MFSSTSGPKSKSNSISYSTSAKFDRVVKDQKLDHSKYKGKAYLLARATYHSRQANAPENDVNLIRGR